MSVSKSERTLHEFDFSAIRLDGLSAVLGASDSVVAGRVSNGVRPACLLDALVKIGDADGVARRRVVELVDDELRDSKIPEEEAGTNREGVEEGRVDGISTIGTDRWEEVVEA